MDDQLRFYEAKLQYEIDSWDLFVDLNAKKSVIVVDARSPEAFAREHIPGALNLPHRSMSTASVASLDQDATYVTYCDGIGCNASTKGARNLARLGLQVRELIGGLDWWRRDGYATAGTSAKDGKRIECGCEG